MHVRTFSLLAASMLASLPALAHHNAASHYQLDKSITVEGSVTEFRMVNPHVLVHFTVVAAGGEKQQWIAEGNSVGVLMRVGWKSDSLKAGDLIKVEGRPSRDGSNLVLWTTITKKDGTVLYGGNSIPVFSDQGVPEETRKRLEDLRNQQINQRDQSKPHPTQPEPLKQPPPPNP